MIAAPCNDEEAKFAYYTVEKCHRDKLALESWGFIFELRLNFSCVKDYAWNEVVIGIAWRELQYMKV